MAERLSFYILTHNSEKYLEQILQKIKPVADEMLLVDSGSTDNTYKIAQQYGCRIFFHAFTDFRSQRAFALNRCKNNYVLFLDCDEIPSDALIENIKQLKEQGFSYAAYAVNRYWQVLGKRVHTCYPVLSPDNPIRLIDKRVVHFDEQSTRVHETPYGHTQTGLLKGDLLHITFETAYEMADKLEHYTDLAAKDISERSQKFSPLKKYLSPIAAWLKWYMAKGGYKDGMIGLRLAAYVFKYTAKKYQKAEKLLRSKR